MSTFQGCKSTKKTCMFTHEYSLIPFTFGMGVSAMKKGAKWATSY